MVFVNERVVPEVPYSAIYVYIHIRKYILYIRICIYTDTHTHIYIYIYYAILVVIIMRIGISSSIAEVLGRIVRFRMLQGRHGCAVRILALR